ncbi:MAG: hypothetical protein H6573_07270 [Lewinellaceae bacterium]|nr:hypothetical protein [Phaeodactylibacter sp.]MCB9347302.1 hypothetical protein [Lewinellaceae bacterium]
MGSDAEANLFPEFNRSDAINVYLARNVRTENLGLVGGLTVKSVASDPENAGIILPQNFPPVVIAHELGHYFQLEHTFAFTTRTYPNVAVLLLPDDSYNHYSDPDYSRCLCCDCTDPTSGARLFCVNPNCPFDCECTASNYGDFIADTDVDPGTGYCNGTPCSIALIDPNGQVAVTVDYAPPITNIMSYYNNKIEFTAGQKDRMLQSLMTHGDALTGNDGGDCETFEPPVYLPDGYVFRPVYDAVSEEYVFLPLEGFRIKMKDVSLLFSMGSEIRLTQNFVDFFPLEPLLIPLGRGRAAYKILLEGSNHHDAE